MLIAGRSSQDFHRPQQCANQWTDGAVALCSPMDRIARLTLWLMIAGTCSPLPANFQPQKVQVTVVDAAFSTRQLENQNRSAGMVRYAACNATILADSP
jgi:hypothetical protein